MKSPRWVAPAGIFALAALAACGGTAATPTPGPTPESTSIARTPTRSPTRAPTSVTVRPRTPTSAPSTPAPTPEIEAPAGYDRSCAAGYPWGRQVSRAFVCIEEPRQGLSRDVRPGDEVRVRGFAGGSFENNVIVEFLRLDARGETEELARRALTYGAPDAGMPGAWEIVLRVPDPEPGTVRVLAYFESPRDGARVTEAAVDLVLW